jgi:hypothetical protein
MSVQRTDTKIFNANFDAKAKSDTQKKKKCRQLRRRCYRDTVYYSGEGSVDRITNGMKEKKWYGMAILQEIEWCNLKKKWY